MVRQPSWLLLPDCGRVTPIRDQMPDVDSLHVFCAVAESHQTRWRTFWVQGASYRIIASLRSRGRCRLPSVAYALGSVLARAIYRIPVPEDRSTDHAQRIP